jgi:hypothetical protein
LQEFYRKMNLSVRVHDDDLEIATPAISQSANPSSLPSQSLSSSSTGERPIHPSAWKVLSANFAFTEFSEDGMRRPTPYAVPFGSGKAIRALTPRKEDRPTMDASSQQPHMTAGLDLGDKYSYLGLIDTVSAEVIEEGLLCVRPQRLSGDASPPSSLCA